MSVDKELLIECSSKKEEGWSPDSETNSKDKFIVGKWYKYSGWYIKFNGIVKNIFTASEEIDNYKNYKKSISNFGNPDNTKVLLEDLSEIQQYLPDGHPDKLSSIPETEITLEQFKRHVLCSSLFLDSKDVINKAWQDGLNGILYNPVINSILEEDLIAFSKKNEKPSIENVQSINVNLRTKKKNNKLIF